MADPLWALAGLGAASAPLAACLVAALARRRRRAARAALMIGSGTPPQAYHLPPTIEAAEREMAVLLRRLRAHLRDPYDFPASRITSETAFEECLERATALGARIAELGGAAPVGPAERERMRGLILEGLMASQRMAAEKATPSPQIGRRGGAAAHAAGPTRRPGRAS
ncbi:hypothetical protein [Roseicella aerolata]|uniref:Uncharacterized protein n=1 Tax=Roseicella aerolata TaxID=2883479 RepID=A0A9X1IEN3_9PROT|nr:hypothetical protein [Roseicella aerolata]MCB4823294.1 hypothetical protein [Roseicella aerolata]